MSDPALEQLVKELVEGELAPGRETQLAELLADDAALDYYVSYVRLHGMLKRRFAATPAFAPAVPLAPPNAWDRLRPYFYQPLALSLMVAALAITTIVLSLALLALPQWQPAAAPEANRHAHFVARLVRTHAAQWSADTDVQANRVSELYAGQTLTLETGMAEIRFDSGASVLLEAPAVFQPRSNLSGKLLVGRLVARVPPQALGFSIDTPGARIVDLGTEFGVGVDADGAADVAVFEGAVELVLHESADNAENRANDAARAPQRLVAGQALRIDPARGGVTPFAPPPHHFARTLPAAQPRAASAPQETIAHWRFEGEGRAFLRDSSGHGHHLHAIDDVKPRRLQASPAGAQFPNRLARLDGVENRFAADFGARAGYLEVGGGPFAPASFTVEALVHRARVTGGVSTTRGYFIASQWNRTGDNRSWALGVKGKDGAVVNGGPDTGSRLADHELFLYYSPTGDTTATSKFVGSGFVLQPGTDYYVALSYAGAAPGETGRAIFHVRDLSQVNAVLESTAVDVPRGIYSTENTLFRIGQLLSPSDIAANNNRWSGLIDEVRFSGRALSADELLISHGPAR